MSQLEKANALITTTPPKDVGSGAVVKVHGSTSPIVNLAHELLHLKIPQVKTVFQVLKQVASRAPIDDRLLMLEHVVTLMQHLPTNSILGEKIANAFTTLLWKDLPHPPATFTGPEFRFHTADGSNNNPYRPWMGAAGQPFSRTVAPLKPKSPTLPSPELVYEELLRRRDFVPHKSGLNRFMFSFATFLIHDLFQSNDKENHINNTSSYFDLAPIYGNNQDEQDKVRSFEQGLLWPDTIASDRIMLMAPGVVAMAIMFSRHHNYLAKRLFEVNETGKYKPWDSLTAEQKTWQDNEIFQLARNINCAMFVKCVLTDYVSAILNTMRADSEWFLDIGKEYRNLQGERIERGTGNSVSCEFNVLYHWHATLSCADEKWMIEVFQSQKEFQGIPPDQITPYQFIQMAIKLKAKLHEKDPKEWEFSGLKRGQDGSFDDVQLGNLIKDCIEEPARAFGARATPSSFKAIEMLGMIQAREGFQVCTMNEFREYLDLKKFSTFIEWNSDPEIAAAAEKLYGHVDNLELYPGLMAEDTKPNMSGSGVQPGHTIGRGILGDAVALVRGDRFMTHDLNTSTLTNWGMAQLQPAPGAYGGHLAHILQRALPYSWGQGISTYSHLPMYTPTALKKILLDNGKLDKYDINRPTSAYKMQVLGTHAAIKEALESCSTFSVLNKTSSNVNFMSWDDPKLHDSVKKVMYNAFFGPSFDLLCRQFFAQQMYDRINAGSSQISETPVKCQLDMIKDVFNVVPIYWLAEKFGIPLKTEQCPLGLITVEDLRASLMTMFTFESNVYLPSQTFGLLEEVKNQSSLLRKILEARYTTTSGARGFLTNILTKGSHYALNEQAKEFYSTLHSNQISMEQAIAGTIGIMLPAAANLTVQPSLLLDLFLKPEYSYAKERLVQLAEREDGEAYKEFEMWIFEGMRVCSAMPAVMRQAMKSTTIRDGERTVKMMKGDNVVLAISSANMDPIVFPNPEQLDPTRSKKDYIQFGSGLHFCFGARMVMPAIVTMMKEVFKLPNIRREKSKVGNLIRMGNVIGKSEEESVEIFKYLDGECQEVSGPTSMVVEFDSITTKCS